MEFGAAILATMASAGAGAGAAASAGGGLLASLGSVSGIATILSGTATVASALAAAREGQVKGLAYAGAAKDAELEAQLEQTQGLDRRNTLRKALIDTIAERDVAAAASGVDLSFGTPATAREQAARDSERALAIDQSSEDFRRARLAERVVNYRTMAAEARRGGLAKAAGLALSGAAALARRG